MSGLVQAGAVAPAFALPAPDGSVVRLDALRGNGGALLVFYPGNDTPG